MQITYLIQVAIYISFAHLISISSAQECPAGDKIDVIYRDTKSCTIGADPVKQNKCEKECTDKNTGSRFGDLISSRCSRSNCVCSFCDKVGAAGGGACGETSKPRLKSSSEYRTAGSGGRIVEGKTCPNPSVHIFTADQLCSSGSDKCTRRCQAEFGANLVDAACESENACVCLRCAFYTPPISSYRSQRKLIPDQHSICRTVPEITIEKFRTKVKPCTADSCSEKCNLGIGKFRGKEHLLTASYCLNGKDCVCERCDENDVLVTKTQGGKCQNTVFSRYRKLCNEGTKQCEALCNRLEGKDDIVQAFCDGNSAECICEACV